MKEITIQLSRKDCEELTDIEIKLGFTKSEDREKVIQEKLNFCGKALIG